MANEWWKQPIKKPTPWWNQPKKQEWWEVVAAQNRMKRPTTGSASNNPPQPQSAPRVQGTAVDTGAYPGSGGGGGGGYDPYAAERIAAAAKKAEDDAKRGKLKGKANSYLDQLMALYDELTGMIQKTGADNTNRINKSYDGKVLEQHELMNEGMYQTDASNAANNLASSSFMAFDRGKVRKAKEANESKLNEARSGDLATIGKMVSEDTARFQADKAGIGNTRELLGQTEDIGELTSTVNNLDGAVRGAQASKGKYGTQGEFVQKAQGLGNYDTSTLEKSMAAIVANTSASPANKQAAMDDLLNGTPLDETKKKDLKNKYTQVV